MSRVVVGADGSLGALLVGSLGARPVRLRHPAKTLDARVPEVADARFVVNVAGPRVRPGLGWDDYLREHVGCSLAVARSMPAGSHLVHVSSASVYGARGGSIRADAAEAPSSFPNPCYAWAKLAAEQAVRAYCQAHGVGLTVLRPAMVYGGGLTSAIDTLAALRARGILLDLRPAGVRQHGVSSALLTAIVERLEAEGPQSGPVLACDPFVYTNGELTAALARPGLVRVPVPLPLASAVMSRLPRYPDLDAPGALAAFAVLGLDCAFDHRGTFDALGLDEELFSRARTLDPYLRSLA
jgi:nucleoside-diphosphate-sugar epimerase